MKDYEPVMSFGEDVAQMYRDVQRGDEMAAVAFLGHLAGPGPALELAIGTGRIALPLAARGIRVDGIDISPAMVAQLRAKPGGDQLSVTLGDFAEVPVPGTYRLIFVVWNTLYFGVHRHTYSISMMNTDTSGLQLLAGAIVEAMFALLAAMVVVGILWRKAGAGEIGRDAVNTLFLIAAALAVQLFIFYVAWDAIFSIYLSF